MTIEWLYGYSDLALLLMRLLVGAVFLDSGWKHVSHPVERAKSVELSPGVTRFLGLAELAGGLGVALGILTQFAALGLILVMSGAIYKKIAVWHTGFWGKSGNGWHYDLLFVVMCLVIATTGGGRYVLERAIGY